MPGTMRRLLNGLRRNNTGSVIPSAVRIGARKWHLQNGHWAR